MEKQLRFDLGDRHSYLDALMEGKRIREYQSWRIYFSSNTNSFQLGIRSLGPVETDHEFIEQLSLDDALWLIVYRHVSPHIGVRELIDSMVKKAA
ncbi:hypothetical protein EVB55_253 [Rhizobium phage RHph_Y68]|uniref:Uncharacterized protein n=1 Tax=Rhizobium phage RHph_Y68 TaxID=2509787 RepID=A0A7S5QY86_9CAUD|nr:hypothetical protein PP934_gp253 [Rhizobium phage RHph_Y68]QIG68188.1 hypothetical protein EVB55_253 [Rhizobium phage RHph_Y68]